MNTWNAVDYERHAATNRLRDLLVMAVFSLAALAAAFVVVQYLHTDRKETESSAAPKTAAEAVAYLPPRQTESAEAPMLALVPAMEVQAEAQSSVRAELQRVRGELGAAVERISKLEHTVEELQAVPARDPRPEPETPALSRAEPPLSSKAAPAAPPSRDDANETREKTEQVMGEDVAQGGGQTLRYLVERGDRAAEIAKRHCLSLADLQRLNRDVRDLNALGVGQILSVEDRCVSDRKDRAAAD